MSKIEQLFKDKPFYESNYQYCLSLGLTEEEIQSAVASASREDIMELDRNSVGWVWETGGNK